EFLARALRLAPHLGQPAEEPQVDPGNRDAQSARLQRVPELVQDERGEVAERACDRDRVRGRARAAEHFVEVARQPVDEEEEDEEPARPDPDADPEDPRELQVFSWPHAWA